MHLRGVGLGDAELARKMVIGWRTIYPLSFGQRLHGTGHVVAVECDYRGCAKRKGGKEEVLSLLVVLRGLRTALVIFHWKADLSD